MSGGKKTGSFLKRVWNEAADTWPRLPLVGYGLMLAWLMLAHTGSLWLSDVETSNQHLSVLYLCTSFASGATYLAASLKPALSVRLISQRSTMVLAGFLTSLGSIVIIVVGPYYLGTFVNWVPLNIAFCIAGVVAGVGCGMIGLRLAMLYGSQPPRVTLLFAGFSVCLMAFIYFVFQGSPSWAAVQGGPTYAGMALFILLPLVTAAVALMPAKASRLALSDAKEHRTARPLPSGLYRLVAVGFILAVATSMMRASAIHGMAPSDVVIDNNLLMIVRIVIAAILVFSALAMAVRPINFGKVSIVVVVVIVLAMTCSSVFVGMWSAPSIVAYATFFLFEVMFWCILSFVVYQKKISVMLVFGLGQGMFLVGCATGWMIGAYVVPQLGDIIPPNSLMTFVGVGVLVASLLLFNDRVFDALFSPAAEGEPSFDAIAVQPRIETDETASPAHRTSMQEAVALIATEFNISPREAEVLRLLATGRGSDFIATDLQLSRNTVRTHTHNIYLKLDVHSREELISFVEGYRL